MPPASHPIASAPVPSDYRGLWLRTACHLEPDAGNAPAPDRAPGWAAWIQTGTWHAELRIPDVALRDRPRAPLAALSAEQLAALTHQSAFAGCTRVHAHPEGELCAWLRRIDYQPPAQSPDAAWVIFEAPDRMLRIDAHRPHCESWARQPDSQGLFRALSGLDAQGQPDGRLLLQAGAHLCLVRARQRAWPRGLKPGLTLVDVLLAQPEHALDWLDHELSFGLLDEDGATWRIERSSLPAREGLCLPLCLQRAPGASQAFVTLEGHRTRWQVLEWTQD